MAKGQQHSNREVKKPKANKSVTVASPSTVKAMMTPASSTPTPKKK